MSFQQKYQQSYQKLSNGLALFKPDADALVKVAAEFAEWIVGPHGLVIDAPEMEGTKAAPVLTVSREDGTAVMDVVIQESGPMAGKIYYSRSELVVMLPIIFTAFRVAQNDREAFAALREEVLNLADGDVINRPLVEGAWNHIAEKYPTADARLPWAVIVYFAAQGREYLWREVTVWPPF